MRRAHVDAARVAAATSDTNDLMGYEGAATAAYYRAFARRVLEPEFAFVKRSKQPPKDRINSLLSFVYSLLYGEMQATLLAHGLDPMPAVLHELGRTHAALASDLIEPHRSLLADAVVLTLVNQHQVKPEGFETNAKGAVLMTRDTRRTVLEVYERMMRRPLGARPGATSAHRLLHAAARAFLHVVLGEAESLALPLRAGEVDADDSIEIIGEELLGASAAAPEAA